MWWKVCSHIGCCSKLGDIKVLISCLVWIIKFYIFFYKHDLNWCFHRGGGEGGRGGPCVMDQLKPIFKPWTFQCCKFLIYTRVFKYINCKNRWQDIPLPKKKKKVPWINHQFIWFCLNCVIVFCNIIKYILNFWFS